MLTAGADIIDVGGESTRPGAPEVSVADEIARVEPIIKAIKQEFNCAVSLDTSKAEVMEVGLTHGVDLINDVCALANPGCLEVVAKSDVPVCLMHMIGTPRTMQNNPQYTDLVQDISQFFIDKMALCEQHGIHKDRIWLDPGFGFGKTLNHNYQLLNELAQISQLNSKLLIGVSRKSMIGNLLHLPVEERTLASVVAATIAMTKGAKILRVHDVAETKQAVRLFNACEYGEINE